MESLKEKVLCTVCIGVSPWVTGGPGDTLPRVLSGCSTRVMSDLILEGLRCSEQSQMEIHPPDLM